MSMLLDWAHIFVRKLYYSPWFLGISGAFSFLPVELAHSFQAYWWFLSFFKALNEAMACGMVAFPTFGHLLPSVRNAIPTCYSVTSIVPSKCFVDSSALWAVRCVDSLSVSPSLTIHLYLCIFPSSPSFFPPSSQDVIDLIENWLILAVELFLNDIDQICQEEF